GLAGQLGEQIELQRRQRDQFLATPDLMAVHVDHQVPDAEGLRGELLGATDPGLDPRHQLLGFEGLGEVVIGPRLEPLDHVSGVGAGVSMMTGTPDSRRSWRQTSMPSMPGSMRSSSTRSGRSRGKVSRAEAPSGEVATS